MQEAFFPIGSVTEQLVTQYLVQKGHKLLRQNYRGRGFELDIVSILNKTLVVTEVKFRNSRTEDIDLETLINAQKKRYLKRGIESFLSCLQLKIETVRCDLALTCLALKDGKMLKKPYNLRSGIRLYYFEDISLES